MNKETSLNQNCGKNSEYIMVRFLSPSVIFSIYYSDHIKHFT